MPNSPVSIEDSNGPDWWRKHEIDVKATFNVLHSFLPTHNPFATMVSINAGAIQVPELKMNQSGYNRSKFAVLKIMEIMAEETKDVYVVSMHPGIGVFHLIQPHAACCLMMDTTPIAVETDMMEASGMQHQLCSNEIMFLRCRFIWCTFNVDEMEVINGEIEGSLVLTANCIDWLFQ